MNAVEIVFTGLVYLLGTSSTEQSGVVRVTIPNASTPSAPFGYVVPEHVAYIRLRPDQVVNFGDSAVRPPDFVYRAMAGAASNANPELAVFLLHGDTITLGNQMSSALTICRLTNCGKRINDVQKTSYERIPHKQIICPECSTLDPSYSTSMPNMEMVSARMTLDHGTLSAAHEDDSEWTFEPMRKKVTFDSGKPYPKQYVADQVVLDVGASSGNVTLSVTPFGEADPDWTLTLRDKAEVEIGNLMLDDVLPQQTHMRMEAVDPHFALFYTMLSRPFTSDPDSITDPRVPHRVNFPRQFGGPRQNCVPLADEH